MRKYGDASLLVRTDKRPKSMPHAIRARGVAQAFSLLYRRLPVGGLLESTSALQVENLAPSGLRRCSHYVKYGSPSVMARFANSLLPVPVNPARTLSGRTAN